MRLGFFLENSSCVNTVRGKMAVPDRGVSRTAEHMLDEQREGGSSDNKKRNLNWK